MNVPVNMRVVFGMALCLLCAFSVGAEIRVQDSGGTPQELGEFLAGSSFFSDADDAYVTLNSSGDIDAEIVYYSGAACSGTPYAEQQFGDTVKQVLKSNGAYYKRTSVPPASVSVQTWRETDGTCNPGTGTVQIEAFLLETYTPSFDLPVELPLITSWQYDDEGTPGAQGINCWDADENGDCTLPDEDSDGDGDCDVADCQYLRRTVILLP